MNIRVTECRVKYATCRQTAVLDLLTKMQTQYLIRRNLKYCNQFKFTNCGGGGVSNIKNNLSAIRRDARKVPELLRTAFGVVVRPLQTQSPIDPHFKSYSQRPYRENETLVPIRVATPK